MSIFSRALLAFGIRHQITKMQEEATELALACARWQDYRAGSDEMIAEEVADCEIMCAQMRVIFGEELIDSVKKEKLRKLERRILDREAIG